MSFMNWIATQGLTTLVGPSRSLQGGKYVDTQLTHDANGLPAKVYGSYSSPGHFKSVKKADGSHQESLTKNLREGVYKINQQALAAAIKKGTFVGRSLKSRLLVQEYFLGQLAVIVPPVANGKVLSGTDQTVLQSLGTNLGKELKKTRYMRNALEQVNGPEVFKIGVGKAFTAVDFFVGAIVINNSNVPIQNDVLAVESNGVAFLPLNTSGTYMNNWSNANTGNVYGLPTRKSITLGELGSGQTGGYISLTPSRSENTLLLEFAGTKYVEEGSEWAKRITQNNVSYFPSGLMKKFFQDLSPWAVVIEVPKEGVPSISHLVKLNSGYYGQYLTIDAATAFPSSATPAAAVPSTTSGSLSSSSSPSAAVSSLPQNFTLQDIINGPYKMYQQSFIAASSGNKTRKTFTSNYPLGHYLGQGFLNGYLEGSGEFAPLAQGPEQYFKTKNTPFGIENAGLQFDRSIIAPGAPQMLGSGSGTNWLMLRALRITKALLFVEGISEKLFDILDASGKPLILQALKNPTQDIFANSKDHSVSPSQNYSGALMRGLVPTKKKHAKKVDVEDGVALFIGASVPVNKSTTNKYPYLPIIEVKVMPPSQASVIKSFNNLQASFDDVLSLSGLQAGQKAKIIAAQAALNNLIGISHAKNVAIGTAVKSLVSKLSGATGGFIWPHSSNKVLHEKAVKNFIEIEKSFSGLMNKLQRATTETAMLSFFKKADLQPSDSYSCTFPGAYKASCVNSRCNKTDFMAFCKGGKELYTKSTIAINDIVGDLNNRKSKLVSMPLPKGSRDCSFQRGHYGETCYNCFCKDGKMTCLCNTEVAKTKVWKAVSIAMKDIVGALNNIKGKLVSSPAPKGSHSCSFSGPYKKSCINGRCTETDFFAYCNDFKGGYSYTTIAKKDIIGGLKNVKGQLVSLEKPKIKLKPKTKIKPVVVRKPKPHDGSSMSSVQAYRRGYRTGQAEAASIATPQPNPVINHESVTSNSAVQAYRRGYRTGQAEAARDNQNNDGYDSGQNSNPFNEEGDY